MKQNVLKVIAIVLGVLLVASVAGLILSPNQKDIDAAVNDAVIKVNNANAINANALNEKIDELSDEIDSLTVEKSDLEAQLETSAEDKAALEEQIAAIEEAIAGAEEEVAFYEEVAEIIDEIPLGDAVTFDLDDDDVEKLLDTEIEFDGDDYDVHEEFASGDYLVVAMNGYGYEEEFGNSAYLIVSDERALVYRYVFDDTIKLSDITEDEPLEIVFLGQNLKIVDADKYEVEVEFGAEFLLNLNEPQMYNDLPIALIGINDDEAYISYNGETEAVDEGQTKEIGGIDVKLEKAFYSDLGAGTGLARVVVGEDVSRIVENGDEFIEDDERFLFEIEADNEELFGFTIVYDVKSDELDDEFPPLAVGDKIVFPNDYLTFEFKEVSDVEYIPVEVYFDDFDAEDELTFDSNAVVIDADNDAIEIDDEEVEQVYLMEDGLFYYTNDDDELVKANDDFVTIVNDDFELAVTYNANKGVLKFESPIGDVIKVSVNIADEKLGDEEEDAEAGDVVYAGGEYGTLEYDLLTASGVIVLDVEANADDDVVELSVPSDVVEATVAVY